MQKAQEEAEERAKAEWWLHQQEAEDRHNAMAEAKLAKDAKEWEEALQIVAKWEQEYQVYQEQAASPAVEQEAQNEGCATRGILFS